jgi:cell division protein FtsW (lipid II flippase)
MSEEMGLIGNLYILLLYAALCRYTIQSIQVMKDPYSKVIGIGILSLIMVQVFVNVGVNTNIIPNT